MAARLAACGLKASAGVADLGSDPNSAEELQMGRGSITELGSDPNSAGHSICVLVSGFKVF